jgi:hypothetical protein
MCIGYVVLARSGVIVSGEYRNKRYVRPGSGMCESGSMAQTMIAESRGRLVLGYAACGLAGCLWGTGFFFGKIALTEMGVAHMVLYRFLFACAAMAPLVWRHPRMANVAAGLIPGRAGAGAGGQRTGLHRLHHPAMDGASIACRRRAPGSSSIWSRRWGRFWESSFWATDSDPWCGWAVG